ncbi:hypothetical protein M405DRAFT_264463 [Rhizopogon salebrosus TDB-379]|nr:hypothetical protein M405DRAFT_264463 [Rhizopogon salebrosus TDB-379]
MQDGSPRPEGGNLYGSSAIMFLCDKSVYGPVVISQWPGDDDQACQYKQAKLAAEGRQNNSPRPQLPHYLRLGTLPLSISALKQAHNKQTHAHWNRMWRKSPRYARTNRIDPNLLQRSFIKLTANFPKRLTSLYMSLRSQHIALNKHLHRIGKIESPHCTHCPQTEETVHHFILDCQHYQRQRHILTCALGRKASSLPYLLSDPDATPHLVRYINGTRRLKATYGEIPLPTKHPN